MARTALSRKNEAAQRIPEEKRWTVISEETGRRVYMESENGLDRESAEGLAQRLLLPSRVVPQGALDRFGCFQPDLLEAAREAAEREDEE